jgi:hypothetical protein
MSAWAWLDSMANAAVANWHNRKSLKTQQFPKTLRRNMMQPLSQAGVTGKLEIASPGKRWEPQRISFNMLFAADDGWIEASIPSAVACDHRGHAAIQMFRSDDHTMIA